MSITLEQLVQNRRDLIEAHRKNNFTDGIHALLTDLYPDTAHFIYELLQNAEDMRATVVRFVLDKNCIDFEHNGTKRPFNIDDIDAITNIGHNGQKKDDPTSIGKFGVGFKAVFAYTATPIIHSGDYHFKIKDYFVPEFRDVEKLNTIDNNGVAWTKFSFPFNNPKKTASDAFNECLDGLKALDASAVLFLQNIKRIEYMIPSGDIGYVELIDNGNHRIAITYKRPDDLYGHVSRWLRFDRMVDITDDQGNPKTLSTAIAFSLGYDEKTKKDCIMPVKGGGRTFIYFPAEKEHSGLRFHINAPFASTVARDSVRNCQDNNKLIRAISQLLSDSLPVIKEQGLMNHSFFVVLPNSKDNLSAFYQYVFDYVYVAFQKNDYLPTKNGGYTSAKNALSGPAAISNVLKEADMHTLFGIEKTWIINAAQRNSNADYFIQSLDVQSFTFKDFAIIFEPEKRTETARLLKAQENDWLKKFYALCADAYDALDYYASNVFIENMQQAQAIRSTKGEMHKSSDIYILPVNVPLVTNTTPIVNSDFVRSSTKSDKVCAKIRTFFLGELHIQEYGPKIEVEKLLKKYDDRIEVNDQHFKDLLVFAKYQTKHDDIDFSAHAIFLYLNTKNEKLYITKASELFLGKAYGNNSGEVLAPAYGKHCLWNGYSEHYNDKELRKFVAFVNACGIAKHLAIEKQSVYFNPLFHSILSVYDGRRTDCGTDSDWTIPGIERLLGFKSIKINRQIWETLQRCSRYSAYTYATARYSPNGSAPVKTCDSTLVYYLKEYAWLPNRQGDLFKPEDISCSNLHPDFIYDPENKLLEALGIGSATEKKKREQERVKEEAKKAGLHTMTDDEYNKIMDKVKAYDELTAKLAAKNVAPLSGQELLKKQQKHSKSNTSTESDLFAEKETDIEITFRNAKNMNPVQRQLFGRIMESTKEERKRLINWYHGKCQMCDTVIIGYNQTPHFFAKNIISTRNLSNSVRHTTKLAWNSLCLCPNCATKYDVCSRDLNGLFEQIMQTEIVEGSPEKITLSIELDERRQLIRYVPEHFFALKKAMQLIDEEINEYGDI